MKRATCVGTTFVFVRSCLCVLVLIPSLQAKMLSLALIKLGLILTTSPQFSEEVATIRGLSLSEARR